MAQFITIADADDPAIAGYRNIRERDLAGRHHRFVAEGEVVLRFLLTRSRFAVESCLIAEGRRAALQPLLDAANHALTVYVAPQAIMDAIAGFAVHRGILALGRRPDPEPLAALIARMPDRALVIVCVGIANHDNLGGIFRNAAAFGADAVLLDTTCCDPLYRKAIRVSVGAPLTVPFHKGAEAKEIVMALAERRFAQVALSPSGSANLADYRPNRRTALYLGAEGSGLPKAVLDACTSIAIPMAAGFDSLNVATASGIALHHLRHGSALDVNPAGEQ